MGEIHYEIENEKKKKLYACDHFFLQKFNEMETKNNKPSQAKPSPAQHSPQTVKSALGGQSSLQ